MEIIVTVQCFLESNHDLSHDNHENITDEDDPEENNFKSEERTSRHSEPDPEHSDKVPTSRIGSSLPLRNIAAENSGSNICSEVLAEIFVLILALHQCLFVQTKAAALRS